MRPSPRRLAFQEKRGLDEGTVGAGVPKDGVVCWAPWAPGQAWCGGSMNVSTVGGEGRRADLARVGAGGEGGARGSRGSVWMEHRGLSPSQHCH